MNGHIAIELKYKLGNKSKISFITVNSEQFQIKNHGAPNLGRYDAFEDARRVRSLINHTSTGITKGFIIFLTNDNSYYSSMGANSMSKQFKVNEGTKIKSGSKLIWVEGRSGKLPEKSSTGANRLNPINIGFNETIIWHKYSCLN